MVKIVGRFGKEEKEYGELGGDRVVN